MKRLLIWIVVGCTLGGMAWAVGAMVSQTAATRWLDARADEGWVANADASVSGFPFAFQTQFNGLELADPATGLAWSAPDFRFEQSIFRLDRLAAYWPTEQTLASPQERLTLTNTTMEATLDVQPANRFALDAMEARVADLAVTSTADWDLALADAWLRIFRFDDTDARYAVALDATSIVPPNVVRELLDPAGLLPQAIGRALADLTVSFDAPWDMDAIEVARPQITVLEVGEVTAEWGDMLFRATGDLNVTEGGVAEGELAIRAENWRAMVDLAENAGLLPERLRPTAEAMLEVMAGLNGSAENIDATLSFSNGRAFIGPLPIGPAPNLRLR